VARARKPLFYVGGGVNVAGAAESFRSMQEIVTFRTVRLSHGHRGAAERSPPLPRHGRHAWHLCGEYPPCRAATCSLPWEPASMTGQTGDLSKFAPHATVVQIDIDPASISRNVPVAIPIVETRRRCSRNLLPHLRKPDHAAWVAETDEWKRTHPLESSREMAGCRLQRSIRSIAAAFPDAIISTEVGQNQMWTAQYFTFRQSRSFLTSGGLGTMGYGFPAAIGAQLGNPGRRVIDIAGDGSIQMNIQELATAVSEGVPVIVAISTTLSWHGPPMAGGLPESTLTPACAWSATRDARLTALSHRKTARRTRRIS